MLDLMVQFVDLIYLWQKFYQHNYYLNLKDNLSKKIEIENISVKKINDKKYRVLVGPFENFNALKTTYISLNKLGFEGLNIYKK